MSCKRNFRFECEECEYTTDRRYRIKTHFNVVHSDKKVNFVT